MSSRYENLCELAEDAFARWPDRTGSKARAEFWLKKARRINDIPLGPRALYRWRDRAKAARLQKMGEKP